jgi:hypothetical protein
MRNFSILALIVAALLAVPAPARSADDWSFIAGTYALDPSDCKTVGTGKAFSKQWVDALSQEVMTKEGITSPREVHCKFKSSSAADKGWTVKADCEELGVAEAYELAVTSNSDGSVAVLNEDVWGPEPIVFQLCPK